MKNGIFTRKRASLLMLAVASTAFVNAQFLRTSYSQDVPYAMQMNPAMTPSRGYVAPLLGPFGTAVKSNVFGINDVVDMIDAKDNYFSSDDFLSKLKDDNTLTMSVAWDQLGAGWVQGKGFWSFSIGTRIDVGASMPKTLFTFMNDMNGGAIDWTNGVDFSLAGEEIQMQAYQEVGVGYARRINDQLTVGAKVKALFGLARMDFKIQDLSVSTPTGLDFDAASNFDWSDYATIEDIQKAAQEVRSKITGTASMKVAGSMKTSMGGLNWKKKTDGSIDGADMNGFGVSGYGIGLDLGATYKVMDNLTITAGITDLGFISWGKKDAQEITIGVDETYNLDNDDDLMRFAEKVSSEDIINFKMLNMQESEGESTTTSLYTTVSVGGQYKLLDDKLVLGLLSTTRFAKPKTLTELTLSGAYNLSSALNVALSYSMIQSAGQSIGLGLKLGPLYLGTDYMYFGNNSKCVNAMIGLSIPLGKKRL